MTVFEGEKSKRASEKHERAESDSILPIVSETIIPKSTHLYSLIYTSSVSVLYGKIHQLSKDYCMEEAEHHQLLWMKQGKEMK